MQFNSKVNGNNQCKRTSSTKAPRRLFLADIPLFLEEQISCRNNVIKTEGNSSLCGNDFGCATSRPVRLMGTVIEMSHSPSDVSAQSSSQFAGDTDFSSHQPNLKRKWENGECSNLQAAENSSEKNCTNVGNSDETTYSTIKFVIDDGTGAFDVITKRKTTKNDSSSSSSNNLSACASAPHQKHSYQNMQHKYKFQQKSNQQPSSPKKTSIHDLLSSPPPPIRLGQTVDCIGQIHFDENSQTQWLKASSVSIVCHPQEETLRRLELSSSSERGIHGNADNFSARCKAEKDDGIPKNRILAAGNLAYKLSPLYYHCNENPNSAHYHYAALKTDDAYRFIRYSRDDGGINAKDLELLVGASRPNEKRAVRIAVEELQRQCMVYMKEGKYFPL